MLWAGATQQILATAHYSDGTIRDVSHAAFYASNAPHVAEVDPQGLVRVGHNPGEAAITVNYMGQVAAVQVHDTTTERGLLLTLVLVGISSGLLPLLRGRSA